MHSITLSTLNARYIHASLGLRYLLANMGDLREQTQLQEFTLEQRAEDIAEALLQRQPRIIGFGVYIWNVLQTTDVIRLIKIIDPSIVIIVGGPEVSFEIGEQSITQLADHVIIGQADIAFGELCKELIDATAVDHESSLPDKSAAENSRAAKTLPGKLISPLPVVLNNLASPYPCYNDDDLAHRVLYVEASRGCPFKCEFCLSSLDKTAVAFDIDQFLAQMQSLIDRGARQFKFVDRTFNLKAETGRRILLFFLQQKNQDLFLHFELIPDRLPEALRELLPEFKAGSLQFEIGIQSFNPAVQQLISRKQNHDKTVANLRWLREHTQAHIHADLIAGLPGEDLVSFGQGFDLLYSLGPQEIQVGILKRLRGTPIARHTTDYDMRYMSVPPYRILSTRDMPFDDLQRMVRFARYWDLIGNSGRFPATLARILSDAPFKRFMMFCEWLFAHSAQTHGIALPKLFKLIWQGMNALAQANQLELDRHGLQESLHSDFKHNKLKGTLRLSDALPNPQNMGSSVARRQNRHISSSA